MSLEYQATYHREWYKTHKQSEIDRVKEYYQANKESIKQKNIEREIRRKENPLLVIQPYIKDRVEEEKPSSITKKQQENVEKDRLKNMSRCIRISHNKIISFGF